MRQRVGLARPEQEFRALGRIAKQVGDTLREALNRGTAPTGPQHEPCDEGLKRECRPNDAWPDRGTVSEDQPRQCQNGQDSGNAEQLLIQQAALCWLKLNLVELSYSGTMKQSITLTLGIYWEKRLSAAQRRFTRACETLARVRKLSRNTPALQFNIATSGGQQVNVAK